MKKKQRPEGTMVLGVRFPVFIPDDEDKAKKRVVINSIREYRQGLRRASSLWYLAQVLASEPRLNKDEWLQAYVQGMPKSMQDTILNALKDEDKNAVGEYLAKNTPLKQVLALFTGSGNPGKAYLYELREFFAQQYPNWKSWLYDMAQKEVAVKVNSKDAKLTNCRRSWLILNFQRDPPRFAWVGIPVKYDRAHTTDCEFLEAGKSIRLRWNRNIGWVDFKLPKLDPGVYYLWKQIASGRWMAASPRINYDKKNRLYISMSYQRPVKDTKLDPNRVLEVDFEKGACRPSELERKRGCRVLAYCRIDAPAKGRKGKPLDDIRVVELYSEEALQFVVRNGKQQDRWRRRKATAAVLAKAERWAQARRDAVTENRTRVCRDWNNVWAKEIAELAVRWNCGVVRVFDSPQTMAGVDWQFAHLKQVLRTKATLYDFQLDFVDNPVVEPVSMDQTEEEKDE